MPISPAGMGVGSAPGGRAAQQPFSPPVGGEGFAGRVEFGDPAGEDVGDGERSSQTITANLVHAPASQAIRVWVGAVVLLLLVVIPGVLVLRSNSANPAADQLNALTVPSWASANSQTHTSGSRYCLDQCLVTERTWDSTKSIDETAAAYATALRAEGWTQSSSCPKFPGGVQTCWLLNKDQLDLTVGTAPCAMAPPPTNRSDVDSQPTTQPAKPPAGCSPTLVHAKITDQVNTSSRGS